MKSFLEPLRQFFTFYHFYGIYAHINSPSCCLKKPFAEFFFLFLFHPIQPPPKTHSILSCEKRFMASVKHFFCAKGICEQEKLMLLKAPHIKIFFFSRRGKSLCYFAKKKHKTRTKHNKYNLVMRNL